ncbi:heavy metal-associated isoprenylated plant protein 3-like [Miscanthus floridulus]|uniref:heavy metal-associated isoprenylated plant protein 3-like n=1 Tax=Miscanthus floridulus TaxID=154761 RepID=UPI0034584CAE
MGAGKGGDGGGEAAAAAPEAAQPVVLKMDLHCAGCAHKVKKAIKRVPGVESIVTDVAANRVVVAGTADAGALKARLEAKTSKPVEVVSAGGAPKKPAAAEPKQDAGTGEKKEDKGASAKEKEKKQQAEEKKPRQETVLLKIRLHCDGCADRIRRRIYKIKGVKDVVLEGNAKDEVKVTGTMDIPNMLTYLKEKLNRDVEAVAPPAKKDGGGGEGKDDKKDSGSGGDKNKGAAGAGAGGDDKKDKGKGIDVSAGPSTAAAAAFMAAPAGASTYHVAPPYGYVAYQQAPPPASYYPSYPYYGNGDGMGHANPSYYHQPQQQQPDGSQQPPMAYPPYPYRFDMAPPPQLFSDENPNSCSVM